MSSRRRVVVTGLGVVSSLGHEVKLVWKKVLAGECAITKLKDPGFKNVPVQIAATVSPETGDFDAKTWISKMKERRVPTSEVVFAYSAARLALQDANLFNLQDDEREYIGVAIGAGLLPVEYVVSEHKKFTEKGPRRVSPYFVSNVLVNTPSGIISMEFGLQGPNLVTTTACSASSHAIGEAFRLIRNGDTDVMVTGGTEAPVAPILLSAFARINALTTKFNENPAESSRPFDKDRSGFVMAEGAAVLILEFPRYSDSKLKPHYQGEWEPGTFLLHEYEHAKQRNAKIYAEVLGYGLSGDAYHLTAPSEDGRGAIRCMKGALRDANLQTKDISYINAHATSTPLGDAIENRAIKELFNDHSRQLKISSTKGATGHLLGAAGAIEAVLTSLALKERVAPPTLNLHEVSSKSEFNLNYVPKVPQELSVQNGGKLIALSNSFGFGGANACLCLGEV